MENMPGLVATYDLLGVAVHVEIPDVAAGRRVRRLLAGTPRTRCEPQHRVHLGTSGEAGFILRDGLHVVRDRMAPPLAVSTLLWYLNTLAAATTRYAVLHAGCVARDGRAIVLTGPTRSGKSTLVTALALQEFAFLSDELAAVDLDDGRLHPYPRPAVIRAGSFSCFPHRRPRVEPKFEDATRWHLPATTFPLSCSRGPGNPGAVVFCSYRQGARSCLESLGRAEALRLLADRTLNLHLLGGRAITALGRVPAYRLVFDDLAEVSAALRVVEVAGGRP